MPMGKRKSATIVDQLRQAIVASGKTHYRLWKDSGVTVPALGRFMAGERGLTFDSAAKLATALGLELRERR